MEMIAIEKLDRKSRYAIALQRAIEHHCRGKLIPEEIGKFCPHHAKMLNERLATLRNLFLG